jgi:hypothetical protein
VPFNNKTDITEKLLKVTIKANNSNQIYDHSGCMIATYPYLKNPSNVCGNAFRLSKLVFKIGAQFKFES